MYFHASSVKGIKVLTPCVSNHNVSLIYFSKKRENVLVYLSNAVETITDSGFQLQIPDAATSKKPMPVKYVEFVPDAYEAILTAEKEGLIAIVRYEDMSKSQIEWIERTIRDEYASATECPDYRHFIEGKFPFIKQ